MNRRFLLIHFFNTLKHLDNYQGVFCNIQKEFTIITNYGILKEQQKLQGG